MGAVDRHFSYRSMVNDKGGGNNLKREKNGWEVVRDGKCNVSSLGIPCVSQSTINQKDTKHISRSAECLFS